MTRAVRHSSATAEHYTPLDIVAAARYVLGSIDLDPATCAAVNRDIKATRIFTKRDDGLKYMWYGRVFLNPPGGGFETARPTYSGDQTRSSQVLWWDYLVDEYEKGRVPSAIFVSFSVELLQAAQLDGLRHPLDYPVCFPKKRLRFDTMRGRKRVVGRQPTHANMIVYLPPGKRVAQARYRPSEALERVKAYISEEQRAAEAALSRDVASQENLSAVAQAAKEVREIIDERGSAAARVTRVRAWIDAQDEPWPSRVAEQVGSIVGRPGKRRYVEWAAVQRFKEAFEGFGKINGALQI